VTDLARTDGATGETEAGPGRGAPARSRWDRDHPHYRWVALSNTTVGMLLATLNSSIVLISLPAIFRGIGLDPAAERGAAAGMRGTFFNAGSSLSIGVFFSLMIVGLARGLPGALGGGLTSHGVPAGVAHQVAGLPPVGSLFAAFLGYNPVASLLGPSGVL